MTYLIPTTRRQSKGWIRCTLLGFCIGMALGYQAGSHVTEADRLAMGKEYVSLAVLDMPVARYGFAEPVPMRKPNQTNE
jgi:DNA mismatch repair protein MutH